MLEPAIKYRNQLESLYYGIWFSEKYKYYSYGVSYNSINIEESTYDYHQFVSVVDGKVVGYISYCIIRQEYNVSNLEVLKFDDEHDLEFGKDLYVAMRDIFERFGFRKLSFKVVIGNPVEAAYDKIIEKFGGRIVGIQKEEVRLIDGKFYDVKLYEILSKDYFKKKFSKTIYKCK